VGMLTAIGADPGQCGYTHTQINDCLKNIQEKGIHQESAGAQHLNFLLYQKGLIPSDNKNKKGIKAHPEILKVRIDPERSPVEEIPREIRRGLFEIFVKYSEGTVKRQGRIWVDHDLFNDPELSGPYPFERKTVNFESTTMKITDDDSQKHNYLLSELTWPEARKRFKEVDIALLPVGAIEQHGPHLPLDTDAFDAEYLARKVAERCRKPQPLVLPLVPYGVSYHHDDFSGTISVSNDTLSRFTYEIGMSAAKNGITKLIIINGHGGNVPALKFAAQMINRDSRIFTTVDTGETSDADLAHICETDNDVHAGEIETSTSLATRPHLVQMKKARKFVPEFSIQYLNFSTKRSVEWFARTSRISPDGILGDPTRASAEKGQKMWEIMINNLVELVESLKNMSLNEIYEKRF
jgi:creatinine amidohydrolase/Fe(II)-dependent formamide hydrolase-like protein